MMPRTEKTIGHAEALFDEEDEAFQAPAAGVSQLASIGNAGATPASPKGGKSVKGKVARKARGLPKHLMHCKAVLRDGMLETVLYFCVPTDDPDAFVHVSSPAVQTQTLQVVDLTPEALMAYVTERATDGTLI